MSEEVAIACSLPFSTGGMDQAVLHHLKGAIKTLVNPKQSNSYSFFRGSVLDRMGRQLFEGVQLYLAVAFSQAPNCLPILSLELRAAIPNFRSSDVLGLKLPKTFNHGAGQDFWEW